MSLISIAMCTYNGERFLKEQLDSLVNQSYKNIELIICDDCSTDNTVRIIEEYMKEDDRIKFYQNKTNLGFVKNFEKAISLCSGDYIALADQDDIWKLEKLAVFIENIKDNILIYSDAELIDDNADKLNKHLIADKKNLVSGKCNKAFLFFNCVSGNTMMFKKELIDKILPIPSEFSFHDIWIAFISSSIGTITYTNESMIYYRRYSEQVTASKQRSYQSFFDRLKQKKEQYKKSARSSLNDFRCLAKLNFLDSDTIKLLKILVDHFENYDKGFFNKELYDLLILDLDSFFAIKQQKKRKKYARKISSKLKLNQLLFFSM
ncbi:MAG: glycosyltransferase family 2 protein [Thiovulaceae bacterium]|nr:glycosyltransferase family 2 protein [Sulfurimonadaceae bacterium]